MFYSYHYVIDWEAVKTLEDVKRLIAAMDIAFGPENKNLETIRDLVKREQR